MDKQKIKVLIIEPEKAAYEAEIGDSLADMQKVVGGLIQAVYPYEEPVALICNEEGKMEGLPLNRALYDEAGNIYDIVAGTFFICGLGEENFASLSPEHMEKFKKEFRDHELFPRIGGKLVVIKVQGESQKDTPPQTHDDRDER